MTQPDQDEARFNEEVRKTAEQFTKELVERLELADPESDTSVLVLVQNNRMVNVSENFPTREAAETALTLALRSYSQETADAEAERLSGEPEQGSMPPRSLEDLQSGG